MSTPTLLVTADPTKGIKVNADIFAKPYREEIQKKVQELKNTGREPPLLVGLLANNDPAAKQYAEWTGKACKNDGLRYELRVVDDPILVEDALRTANDDPNVHGIIVYYPIFGMQETFSGTSQDDYIRDSVSYKCDVEGLCHLYRTNLYKNIRYLDHPTNTQKCLLPCTALAVVKILESCPGVYYDTNTINNTGRITKTRMLEGKIITIINRSEIVGRPLAAMLANDGATVYSIDVSTIYMFKNGTIHNCSVPNDNVDVDDIATTPELCVRKSSVVITGVPTKDYRLPTNWIQPNTTVVNVASYKNVDETTILQIPGVVYIPQVGKVTVAMLERNLMRLYEQFHHNDDTNVAYMTQQENIKQQQQQRSRAASVSLAAEQEEVAIVKSHLSNPLLQQQQKVELQPWYGHPLNLYTAVIVTVMLAVQIMKK